MEAVPSSDWGRDPGAGGTYTGQEGLLERM